MLALLADEQAGQLPPEDHVDNGHEFLLFRDLRGRGVGLVQRRGCDGGSPLPLRALGWRWWLALLDDLQEMSVSVPGELSLTHVKLLHPHGIQQNPEKFMSVLLRKVQILVVFTSQEVQDTPACWTLLGGTFSGRRDRRTLG